MNTEVNNEVQVVLNTLSGLQNDSFEQNGKCYKITNGSTNVSGLTYLCVNYWNEDQSAGYGVHFDYVSGTGSYEMSRDIGFLDPDYIIDGFNPVLIFDWRQKRDII
ncbi:MAG: hypothetical protein DWQ49_05885 [Bacteroidetes bacterium]|jgi:hypothetical protein|nr:MAG: hypothetical protein DWQ49_05885 [Bacteroidota bacterium]